jgi:hypothetical protein
LKEELAKKDRSRSKSPHAAPIVGKKTEEDARARCDELEKTVAKLKEDYEKSMSTLIKSSENKNAVARELELLNEVKV